MDKRWALIGLLALAGCGRSDQQEPARRPTVTVAAAASQAGGDKTASIPTEPAPTATIPLPPPASIPPPPPAAETPFDTPPPILSAGEVSPDGLYLVRYGDRIEYPEIQILTAAGELVSADVGAENHDAIGYNTKIGCQCANKIAGWVGPHAFLLRINTGEGKSYGYIVDAATGAVDETSFMELELIIE